MPADATLHSSACNCLAVRSAARRVTQLYDHFLAPVGLRATQFSILGMLKERGALTINALARDLIMDRTTLGRNVLPLERDGLIATKTSPSDGRAKELHLTKDGENRLQAGLKAWSAAQARYEGAFGPERAADLRLMLRSVIGTDFEAA